MGLEEIRVVVSGAMPGGVRRYCGRTMRYLGGVQGAGVHAGADDR